MSEPTIEDLLKDRQFAPDEPYSRGCHHGARAMARAILPKLEYIQKNEGIFWTRQQVIDNLVGRIREALGEES